MAINIEEMVIKQCDAWLEEHELTVEIEQLTKIGRILNDVWNDWYNESILLPVNKAVDEALTNGGYDEDELSVTDIYDICDSVLSVPDRIISLMRSCYFTGYEKGFKDGFEACDE